MPTREEITFELMDVKIHALKKKMYIPGKESINIAQKCIDDINTLSEEDQEKVSVLDIGCGTGFIGLAIAKHTKIKDITFTDINEDNMQYAYTRNLVAIGEDVSVSTKISNLWKGLDGFYFDYVVANLPSLSEEGYEKMVEESGDPDKYLPKEAFCAGENADELLMAFIAGAGSHLKESGYIYFTATSENQAQRLKYYLNEAGFNEIDRFKDSSVLVRAKLSVLKNDKETE